ncbi:MAG: SAM-dependent methyltransferase, partial [Clostridia bacterium]
MTGTLFIVGTPIGNLKDITFRAIDVLKSVDIIACEDTRVSQTLLNAYDIKKHMVSYYKHNEREGTQL